MKIGFLLARKTYLKTMGFLIDEAIRNNNTVVLFVLDPEGVKVNQSLSLKDLATFSTRGAKVIWLRTDGLVDEVILAGIDVLVTQEAQHNFVNKRTDLRRIRDADVIVVSLAHFFETAKYPPEILSLVNQTFYLSKFARDIHFGLQQSPNEAELEIRNRKTSFAVTGSPMFDQLQKINVEVEKRRYGIPINKAAVLFMLPVIEPTTPERNLIWGKANRRQRFKEAVRHKKPSLIPEIVFGKNFQSLVETVREFCDRHQASLIIKSRSKQKDPGYIKNMADLYIDGIEDQYYPVFTSYRLMAISNLCIGANSMSIPEAVAVGVPAVNIRVPIVDFAEKQTTRDREYYKTVLSRKAPSLFNYSGCVTSVGRREIFSWLRQVNLEQVKLDNVRRNAYTSYYLGIQSTPASERILHKIMAMA